MQKKLNCKFNKNSITKFIIGLLTILILFILINLAIGSFKYGGISRYATLLDNKDWSTSISQMSIKHPVAIFYDDAWLLEQEENNDLDEENTEQEISQQPQEEIIIEEELEEDPSIDPYDPEFEDEFNSFFGGEKTQLDNIEDEEEIDTHNSAIDQTTQEPKQSIIKQLIQKFNE